MHKGGEGMSLWKKHLTASSHNFITMLAKRNTKKTSRKSFPYWREVKVAPFNTFISAMEKKAVCNVKCVTLQRWESDLSRKFQDLRLARLTMIKDSL